MTNRVGSKLTDETSYEDGLKNKASMPSTLCSDSRQNTVVTMNGVTIVVSSPELLKSLRLFPGAEQRKVTNYALESSYAMQEHDP